MKKDYKAFLKIERAQSRYRPVCERINDYNDVAILRNDELSREQAHRCMDCGTPFCHWACPIGNYIPEWNDLVSKGQMAKALELLSATNNLPEITGRLCPGLCEYSCVLGINDSPVTIRENELAIIEYGFTHNLIKTNQSIKRTGKKIAVIGSGPAGLAAADQLNRAGHNITVFEKDDKIGGILRYGIPDFKLEKWIIDRRIDLYKKGGIEFITNANVGGNYPIAKLLDEFNAVCITCGSRVPRDLNIEGRNLCGIYFAMDYLTQANRLISGIKIPGKEYIDVKGKKVVVIGGGDTGSDCVGTAIRQNALCVSQIELLPMPKECRSNEFPWPKYPVLLKTTTSHQEGCDRSWEILTKKFIGENNKLKKLSCVQVQLQKNANGYPAFKELPNSDFEIEADVVLLALGFLHPQKNGLLQELNLELNGQGNIKTDENFATSVKGVFTAGDSHRGQSLIVWAVSEGRRAAYCIDKYLMGKSDLPLL